MDFMSDCIQGSRKFRTFNIIDDCTREVLAIEIDTSLTSKRVIRTLSRVIEQRGLPKTLRCDNGPEFTSHELELWCQEKGIQLQFIQPGKPMQNGYVERFNRLYREAVLDAYWFFNLEQVKQLTEEWMDEYNQRRPHEGLNNHTPEEWKNKVQNNEYLQLTTV